MKFTYSAFLAVFAYAAAVMASPGRAPVCDTALAKDGFATSPMAPNNKNLAQENIYTITADSPTYTPGQRIVFSMDGSLPFHGALFYVAPTADPSKRVGKFEIGPNWQNNAQVCQNSEFPESSLTHVAGQTYEAKQQIVFTAPEADQGELELHVIIVVKLAEGGFGWGIWPAAVKLGSATPSFDQGGDYGVTPTPLENNVDTSVECPAAYTATIVRKCKIKAEFKTTIHSTFTQVVTETVFETKTETFTERVTETCNAVLGDQEVPTFETPEVHDIYETPAPLDFHETPEQLDFHETPAQLDIHETAPYDHYGYDYEGY